MIRSKKPEPNWKAYEMKSHCAQTARWIHILCVWSFTLGWLVTSARAAGVPFGPSGSGLFWFGTLPPANEWSTASIPGNGGTAVDLTGLDALVNTLAASGITTQLGTVSADPVGTTTQDGKWNSTALGLTSRAGTTAATCFMATLQNTWGSTVNGLNISFGLSGSAASSEDPGLPGYALYYSLTGLAASWQRIGVFGMLGAVVINNIVLNGAWANNGTLYVLWVDDNGNGGVFRPLASPRSRA
jgi:hypothetical protein